MTGIENVRDSRREALAKEPIRAAGEMALLRVASALYRHRKAQGLSQEELAARTGIDQANISDIENGDANPTIRTVSRLAAGLNADVRDLLEPDLQETLDAEPHAALMDAEWEAVWTQATGKVQYAKKCQAMLKKLVAFKWPEPEQTLVMDLDAYHFFYAPHSLQHAERPERQGESRVHEHRPSGAFLRGS